MGCKKDEPPPPLPSAAPAAVPTPTAPLELAPEELPAASASASVKKPTGGAPAQSFAKCCAALTQNAASAPEPTKTSLTQLLACATAWLRQARAARASSAPSKACCAASACPRPVSDHFAVVRRALMTRVHRAAGRSLGDRPRVALRLRTEALLSLVASLALGHAVKARAPAPMCAHVTGLAKIALTNSAIWRASLRPGHGALLLRAYWHATATYQFESQAR